MAHAAWSTSTSEPWTNTGTATVSAINTARSMLKPAAWWKSGRVCSIEKMAPRTTTRASTPSTSSAASPGACSGVIPAHGASSSHDRRSTTTRVGPTAERTAANTSRAKRSRSPPHSSSRWLVSPDRNWRTRLCWPALTSTPSHPDSTASPAADANPLTTSAMSSASIHFGTSRVATSGTRDGAHSGRWLYADDPCPPAWSSEARTSAPSSWPQRRSPPTRRRSVRPAAPARTASRTRGRWRPRPRSCRTRRAPGVRSRRCGGRVSRRSSSPRLVTCGPNITRLRAVRGPRSSGSSSRAPRLVIDGRSSATGEQDGLGHRRARPGVVHRRAWHGRRGGRPRGRRRPATPRRDPSRIRGRDRRAAGR